MPPPNTKLDPKLLITEEPLTVGRLIEWLKLQKPDVHVYVGILDDDHPDGGVAAAAAVANHLAARPTPETPKGSIQIAGYAPITGYTSLVADDDGDGDDADDLDELDELDFDR